MVVYFFAAIWLLIAIFQLLTGVYDISIGYSQGGWLIFLSIINFIFAGWVLNENRKQIETQKPISR